MPHVFEFEEHDRIDGAERKRSGVDDGARLVRAMGEIAGEVAENEAQAGRGQIEITILNQGADEEAAEIHFRNKPERDPGGAEEIDAAARRAHEKEHGGYDREREERGGHEKIGRQRIGYEENTMRGTGVERKYQQHEIVHKDYRHGHQDLRGGRMVGEVGTADEAEDQQSEAQVGEHQRRVWRDGDSGPAEAWDERARIGGIAGAFAFARRGRSAVVRLEPEGVGGDKTRKGNRTFVTEQGEGVESERPCKAKPRGSAPDEQIESGQFERRSERQWDRRRPYDRFGVNRQETEDESGDGSRERAAAQDDRDQEDQANRD